MSKSNKNSNLKKYVVISAIVLIIILGELSFYYFFGYQKNNYTSKILHNKKKKQSPNYSKITPIGFQNSMCSCFGASVLQLLFSSMKFRNYIQNKNDGNEITKLLKEILEDYLSENDYVKEEKLLILIEKIGIRDRNSSKYQDAFRFFGVLIDRIDEDGGDIFRITGKQNEYRKAFNFNYLFRSIEINSFYLVTSIYDGNSVSELINKYKLSDKEIQEDMEKNQSENNEYSIIEKLSDILFIFIDRNDITNGVIRNKIFIDEELIIKDNEYILRGYVRHRGSHYTAVVKYENLWYHCSDTSIQKMHNNSNKSSEVVLVMYERKKN